MHVSDLCTLTEYHHWANGRLLRRVVHLNPDQLQEPCWLSHKTVLDTLVHMLDVQWSWRIACETGKMPTDMITAVQFKNIKQLRTEWQEDDAHLLAYVQSLSDERLNQLHEYHWARARPRQKTLWHLLLHIINHATHHRSEVGQYLATIDRSPGDMDFVKFVSRKSD